MERGAGLSMLIWGTGRDGEAVAKKDQDGIIRVGGIFQHEYDHLEGILFLDRLASPADLYSEEEYQKISQNFNFGT